jgi:type VI secretion system protein ImpC
MLGMSMDAAVSASPGSSAQPEESAPRASERPLFDELMATSGMPATDARYPLMAEGVVGALRAVVTRGREGDLVDRAFLDLLIAEIDARMAGQIDEILHHPTFTRLEAAWRGLKFLVERVDFRENTRVEVVNCSKEDLLADFEDTPEVPKSGLYKLVYSAEFGQFGGRPYAAIIANYEFGPGPQDILLLQKAAAVATMAHAPFIAAAGPRFFGLQSYENLPNIRDIRALFEGPQYTKYSAFRDTEDARYVGLILPRFLLRLPYGASTAPVRAFSYEEDVTTDHERYLWGNASFAFATRLAESFARYRWLLNITGPSSGGTVDRLILHEYDAMGHLQTKIPTEIMITEHREFELGEQGFIGFTYCKDTDGACFFSANSLQRPRTFGNSEEGRAAALNHKLGTQLPYMFIVSRLSHYIKVMQREQIGTWKERSDLEKELNDWLNQYVADMDVASAAVRARRPLRKSKVTVTDVPGAAGWFRVDLMVRPHFKYMGASFAVNLVGKLDKE